MESVLYKDKCIKQTLVRRFPSYKIWQTCQHSGGCRAGFVIEYPNVILCDSFASYEHNPRYGLNTDQFIFIHGKIPFENPILQSDREWVRTNISQATETEQVFDVLVTLVDTIPTDWIRMLKTFLVE